MKRLLIATVITASAFGASAGFAQAAKPADQDPAMPAVATPSSETPAMPAAGSNSFTEKQATARLAKNSYTNVSGLKKDANGVWRGMAVRNGVKQPVAVDYQGNVTAN